MNKLIPQNFIDEIITRADIVEVVGRRVSLKRAGAYFKGLCPFHDEKTPSFTVTPARGTYHCFGCGVHGTAIRFLMEYDNLPFPEAVETLADMLGLPMPERTVDVQDPVREPMLDLLSEADQLFRAALRKHDAAIRYLKQRGIDGTTAQRFGIGYAPDGWDFLLNELGTNEARRAELLQAGLLRRNDQGRYYDYFRDRIMFPIRDPRGHVIGFGGRVLGDGEPKYLNSPETPVFEKGKTLYGLHEARQSRGPIQDVLVVEGYMDVVSLAQHGIGPALATLGTATTKDHVQKLTRLTDHVIFCFDGDAAGRKAAWRALETCLPFGGGKISLSFMLLPAGEDPDTLVRGGGEAALIKHKNEALSLSAFFMTELRARNDLSTADGRARIIAEAKPLLARLPDGVYRELLIAELAETVGMAVERVTALIVPQTADSAHGLQASRPKRTRQTTPGADDPGAGRKSKLIRRAIALVLKYPEIAANVGEIDDFEEISQPGAELLLELLAAASSTPNVTTAHLIEQFRDHPDGQYLPRLATEDLLDGADVAAAIIRESMQKIVTTEKRRLAADRVKKLGNSVDNSDV